MSSYFKLGSDPLGFHNKIKKKVESDDSEDYSISQNSKETKGADLVKKDKRKKKS